MIVVVPMAGRGSRFASRGVSLPKPLVPVAGRPMIAWALDSLDGLSPSRFIFIVLSEHQREHRIDGLLQKLAGPTAEIMAIDDVTEGQLCTVLCAREKIDTGEDLLIAPCDTLVRSRLAQHVKERGADCAGLISVHRAPGDHWSFARTDPEGRVLEVAEKRRISEWCSTGLYYFSKAGDFLAQADALIDSGERTRGEFFVIPVYSRYIAAGRTIGISMADAVWDLGTPEGVAAFEAHQRRSGA